MAVCMIFQEAIETHFRILANLPSSNNVPDPLNPESLQVFHAKIKSSNQFFDLQDGFTNLIKQAELRVASTLETKQTRGTPAVRRVNEQLIDY